MARENRVLSFLKSFFCWNWFVHDKPIIFAKKIRAIGTLSFSQDLRTKISTSCSSVLQGAKYAPEMILKKCKMVPVFTQSDVNTWEVGRTRDKRRKPRREAEWFPAYHGPLLCLKKHQTKGILVISRIDCILSGFLPFIRQVRLFASKISVHIIFQRESKTLTPQNTQLTLTKDIIIIIIAYYLFPF